MLNEESLQRIFAGIEREEGQSSLIEIELIKQRHKNIFRSIVKEFAQDLGYAEIRKIVGECLDWSDYDKHNSKHLVVCIVERPSNKYRSDKKNNKSRQKRCWMWWLLERAVMERRNTSTLSNFRGERAKRGVISLTIIRSIDIYG